MRDILAALIVLVALTTPATAAGFQPISIPDPGNPDLEAGVWYPSAARPTPIPLGLDDQTVALNKPINGQNLPLIVMSHGTGGWYGSHADTAIALADAGFVVVAVTHTGDNFRDQSRVFRIAERAGHLHAAIDYMLTSWLDHAAIDPTRIGVFGFSAGGFTALVAIGGHADFSLIGPHCAAHPSEWTCNLMRENGVNPGAVVSPAPIYWDHDTRIRAAVVAAPALGYAFGREGLAGITVPIQLWRGEADQILPNPYYAQAVADNLPTPPEYHVVPLAGHFSFLAPCGNGLRQAYPIICTDAPGFDRTAFHQQFNADVIAFFRKTLGPAR